MEPYEELQVPFFKRAQITAADLALAFDGHGPGRFNDLHHFTMFADNLVPHVLRIDNVLRYDGTLASRIDQSELIPARSPEECLLLTRDPPRRLTQAELRLIFCISDNIC